MSFNVEVVADSVHRTRITTLLATFPRYILAEFNTHRALSRNSASSRAIPFLRMLKMVWNHPFIPVKWMKDHKGMQGTSYLTDRRIIRLLTFLWLTARTLAIAVAWLLNKVGLTKQIANRLLEPFMWHTALITATEWENFIALRAEKGADIHMQIIADMMLDALNNSEPRRLKEGEWHMPFGDDIDMPLLYRIINEHCETIPFGDASYIDEDAYLLKVATSRSARTSYLTLGQDPVKHDYLKDFKQHDDLSHNGHWSPFEHCAKAMNSNEYFGSICGTGFRTQSDEVTNYKQMGKDGVRYSHDKPVPRKYRKSGRLIHEHMLDFNDSRFGWSGNFRGWVQYRKTFRNENRRDPRLIKKY